MTLELLAAPRATDRLERPFYTDNPLETAERLRLQAARGTLPLLANGWRFVFDRRPVGQEDKYIPSRVYTGYFAQQEIPVAAADHALHGHDLRHIPSYQNMFRLRSLARLAQQSAQLAVGERKLESQFTRHMNALGDDMRNLEWRLFEYGSVEGARVAIDGLIRICDLNTQESTALSEHIYAGLCLDQYESDAETALV